MFPIDYLLFCFKPLLSLLYVRLDYTGIALLTIGSFVPWLHFSFYCYLSLRLLYLSIVLTLGIVCIVVSTRDYFATPRYRSARALLFICLGLSGVIPCTHYIIMEGFWQAVSSAALGWLILMALLYITGAVIYALRIPERLWPGKFDIWFQSHQIFHVFVVLAALVHLNGILEIAQHRLAKDSCSKNLDAWMPKN